MESSTRRHPPPRQLLRSCSLMPSPPARTPQPLSPNLSRSVSHSKTTSATAASTSCTKPEAAATASCPRHQRATKENRRAASPRPSLGDGGIRRPKLGASAWALSPSRSPQVAATPQTPRRRSFSAAVGGGSGGGGVLGLFRWRKEPSSREEAVHQLRMLTARLMQWRFANARAAATTEGARSAAERKLFYGMLRVSELRKMVAAKRMLVQRRRQKLKLVRVLNAQLHLLFKWDALAKHHTETVSVLGRVLGAACLCLPLVQGAQANMVSLHRYLCVSMEIMKDIEANAKTFYYKAGTISSMLVELMETIQLEIEGLEELTKLSRTIASFEMHETSLRANLIQATEATDEKASYLNQELWSSSYWLNRGQAIKKASNFVH